MYIHIVKLAVKKQNFIIQEKNIMLENIVHEDVLQIVMMLEKKQKRHAQKNMDVKTQEHQKKLKKK